MGKRNDREGQASQRCFYYAAPARFMAILPPLRIYRCTPDNEQRQRQHDRRRVDRRLKHARNRCTRRMYRYVRAADLHPAEESSSHEERR